MIQKKYIGSFILILITILEISCKKYLDQKPQQTLAVPSTLNDLQALLDNVSFINSVRTPGLLETVSDNYYVTSDNWQSVLSTVNEEAMNYVWDKDVPTSLTNWQPSYQGPVYYANIVLDIIPNIKATDENRDFWNSIKGSALFYRAFAFHQLAQIYCQPYSASTASDFGIVIKLNSNINEPIKRSTVQQTYDQIIEDLTIAAELLPASTSFPTRPNKAAAYGALARTYLAMRDYINAGKYSDLSLQQYNVLMDYNNVPGTFLRFNIETLYFNISLRGELLNASIAKIDSNLYNSYNNNDLRKTKFFASNGNGTYRFNGSYSGVAGFPFDGITTDEMYLIRGECYARAGNKEAALADLNTLMVKRWNSNGTWTPFTATDANDAKNKILIERRKELVYSQRWSDIRRLNLEGVDITLKRIINGITYTLPPNDLRSVMLIPQAEINLSGIPQNPR
jgi:starch-binding outer membrane protein, SusD/RagB family